MLRWIYDDSCLKKTKQNWNMLIFNNNNKKVKSLQVKIIFSTVTHLKHWPGSWIPLWPQGMACTSPQKKVKHPESPKSRERSTCCQFVAWLRVCRLFGSTREDRSTTNKPKGCKGASHKVEPWPQLDLTVHVNVLIARAVTGCQLSQYMSALDTHTHSRCRHKPLMYCSCVCVCVCPLTMIHMLGKPPTHCAAPCTDPYVLLLERGWRYGCCTQGCSRLSSDDIAWEQIVMFLFSFGINDSSVYAEMT